MSARFVPSAGVLRALSLFCVLALAACTENERPGARCARLPGGAVYCLQASSAIPPLAMQDRVDVVRPGFGETMIAELESDDDGMHFVALSPLGQTLFRVDDDNRSLSFDNRIGRDFDPALFLALLQMALWPAESVRQGLASPLTLEEEEGHRRIVADGRVRVEVVYTGARLAHEHLRITVPDAQLTLDITPLDREPPQ